MPRSIPSTGPASPSKDAMVSCQACCFAATGAIFAAIESQRCTLDRNDEDAAVLYCCGAILRRCTSVFASSMPGLIAYFGRPNSNPSRRPGTRSFRRQGWANAHDASLVFAARSGMMGATSLAVFERRADSATRCKRSSVTSPDIRLDRIFAFFV